MDEAGLGEKVVYLDRRDQYRFRVGSNVFWTQKSIGFLLSSLGNIMHGCVAFSIWIAIARNINANSQFSPERLPDMYSPTVPPG
jgi:uncharacterized membrane protein